MIEVVQNHTPHVMVIDEIGRAQEMAAAKTTKQRGVRCVASAHGDLRKLVRPTGHSLVISTFSKRGLETSLAAKLIFRCPYPYGIHRGKD